MSDCNFGVVADTGWMLRCEVCGSLYPDRFPVAEDQVDAYGDYYTARPASMGLRAGLRRMLNRSRRAYLDRYTPSAALRVLDYGCGDGVFLARLDGGRQAFGTDNRLPATSPTGFVWLEPADLAAAGPFDWITLGHVLEHVDDPGAVLAHLVGLLAPAGGLWIATPNAQSFLFATAQGWARDADFPRHRQIFSRAALVGLLQTAGLQPRFHRPPRLNALLNAAGTLRNLRRDRTGPRWRRALAGLRTVLALARHCAAPQLARDPEWVVSCHRPLSK